MIYLQDNNNLRAGA